ncbi:MAG: hypothetical protein ACREID_01265, partial [Planctomycetota bacterium]
MARRLFVLGWFACAVAGKEVGLKDLLDPACEAFRLRAYSWEGWEKVPSDEQRRAQGTDPAAWTEPPPAPPPESKPPEEGKKKDAKPEPPRDRHPGFRFVDRLKEKQEAFEKLVGAASAPVLEGLVKQLDHFDKASDRFEKQVAEAEEAYLKTRDLYDKAVEPQIRAHEKKHGKPPDQVMVDRRLAAELETRSRRLQELVALQHSERQFQEWLVERVAAHLAALTDAERAKPFAALAAGLADKEWRQRLRCAAILARTSGDAAGALLAGAL